ncbi:MAG: hypothetical protein Q9163_005378 [Psora crenata]
MLTPKSSMLWALVSITNLNVITSVKASDYGISIGDFIQRTQPVDTGAHANTQSDVLGTSVDSSVPDEPTHWTDLTAGPDGVVNVAEGISNPVSSFSQRIFRTTFDDNGAGYNISLPGWYCADIVLGDWEAPDGTRIVNGSIGDLYSQLRLPANMLTNYTLNRAAALSASINDALTDILCEPIPNTGRALTYDGWRSQDIEGFWEAFFIATGGVFGIGFAGLKWGIIHEGITANITLETQVFILAATGTLQFLCATAMFRLQTNGYLARGEAMLLNAVWTLGEIFRDHLLASWTGTCAAWSTLRNGVNYLAQQALRNVRILYPSELAHGHPSALELVSQVRDVETGHGAMAPPGQGGQCSSG